VVTVLVCRIGRRLRSSLVVSECCSDVESKRQFKATITVVKNVAEATVF
jgi:hypothetical protein